MGWILAPTRSGAVRLALAIHLVVLAFGTVVGLEYHGRAAGMDAWRRWDSTHYVRIAAEGYGGSVESGGPLMSAFLPVYPLLIRGLSVATGSPIVAALLISLAAALVASAALFEIVSRDADPSVARRAVAWLNLYPTSFFLVAGYTEAVFLALVLASLLAARDDRFVLAALAAAVAGATRITGIALLPALAAEVWLVSRERRDGRWTGRAAAVVLVAPLGIVAYLAMNLAVYGNALEFLRHQEIQWQHVPSTPWRELASAVAGVLEQPFSLNRVLLSDALALTIALLAATIVWALLALRLSYAIYAAAAAWLATAVTWNISAPRYAIAVWPLFWGLAVATRRSAVAGVLGGLAGAGLMAVAVRFLTSRWAF
jgi:hypothetical protein